MAKGDSLAKLRREARQYRKIKKRQEKAEKEKYEIELSQAQKTGDIERVLIVMEKFGKIDCAGQEKVDWTKLISNVRIAEVKKILENME